MSDGKKYSNVLRNEKSERQEIGDYILKILSEKLIKIDEKKLSIMEWIAN